MTYLVTTLQMGKSKNMSHISNASWVACVNGFSFPLHPPVCRYPSLSSHQDHVAQLSGPQVALHLAEGDVSVGQGCENAVLWTCTGLQ